MKKAVTFLIIILLWFGKLSVIGGALAETGTLELEPEEGLFGSVEDNPYHSAVGDLLLSANKFRKCQMLFLPSFDKESAVFLVRSGDNPKANAIVVAAEMKEQLWGAINRFLMKEAGEGKPYTIGPVDMRRALSRVSRRVERVEAEIDPSTADLLEKTWESMLLRVRYPPPSNDVGLDGETFHVAHWVNLNGYLTGKTWSPKPSTRIGNFVELAKVLRKYPKLSGDQREAVRKDLISRAEALLKRLNESGQ